MAGSAHGARVGLLGSSVNKMIYSVDPVLRRVVLNDFGADEKFLPILLPNVAMGSISLH